MRSKQGVQRLFALAVATLLALALGKELRTPRDARHWHGKLGIVPYDFRPPTLSRMRSAWWQPHSRTLLTPQPFGVGWTLNFGRLYHALRYSRRTMRAPY